MSKQTIIFNSVLNNLSIGQTSYNFLYAMFKRDDIDVKFHPITGSPIDLSNFPKNEWFEKKLSHAFNTRFDITADTPSIKLWHANGAEQRITRKQFLYTFHETDAVTPTEKSILNMQDGVFTSSSETIRNFSRAGVTTKLKMIPLGLDINTKKNGKDYKFGEKIHWTIMGKVERRKRTIENIKLWLQVYGNNPNHQLSCAIVNQFIKPEEFSKIIQDITGGRQYSNLNFLPYLNCEQVQDFHNSTDIHIAVAASEGWNIPAMSACAIGKQVIVSAVTAHLDWANKDNAILVPPNGMTKCYDNQFFFEGSPFNQGMYYTFSDDDIIKAFKEAEARAKMVNKAGIEMGERLTYDNTVDMILKQIMS